MFSARFRIFLILCGLAGAFGGSLPLEAARIVSLSPAVTELIFHLGRGKDLVGRSSACDYPQEVRRLPVAGDFARPDTEKLLSLRPDAVITNDLIVPAGESYEASTKSILFCPSGSSSSFLISGTGL